MFVAQKYDSIHLYFTPFWGFLTATWHINPQKGVRIPADIPFLCLRSKRNTVTSLYLEKKTTYNSAGLLYLYAT